MLRDITVLDLTHHVAGPFATRLLAAYGARVIKVERPDGGDPARRVGSFAGGGPPSECGARFLYLNTGKESITLNLKTSQGRDRMLALAAQADLIVENFAPGTMATFGLGWETLHQVNPRLVLVSISNFGQIGPKRDWLGTNLTMFAAGGQMRLTGEPEREPLLQGGAQALMQGGLHGFTAAVTALYGARCTGKGTHVDISIQDVQTASLEGAGPVALVHGLDAARSGNLGRAVWGIYPCADGEAGCFCLDRNIPNLLRAIGRPDLLDDPNYRDMRWRLAHDDELMAMMYEFFATHTRREVYERALQYGVPFGVIATIDELVTWPALRAKGFWREIDHPAAGRLTYPGPPFTVDGGGFDLRPAPRLGEHTAAILADKDEGETMKDEPGTGPSSFPNSLPLEGVRIIDMTSVWAGPYGARLLADMGAEVIKVEGPGNPDVARGLGQGSPLNDGPEPWNTSTYFHEYNRNKLAMTVDLTTDAGRQTLLELVRVSDALIENYRADVLDRLGLGPAVLHAARPDLVVVSMPGFAKQGPERDMAGYGPTIEQYGGLVALTGYEGGGPQKSGISYGDPVGGIVAAGALVTALLRRQRTGAGAVVEVAQRDNMLNLIGEAVLEWGITGQAPARRGNRHPRMAPHGCYPSLPLPEEQARPVMRLGGAMDTATDRWVTLAVTNDQQWRALAGVLDQPDLAVDPRFATTAGRLAHQDELDAIITAWTGVRGDDEAAELLQAAGVPAHAVRTPLTITWEEHLGARAMFATVQHSVAGARRTAAPAWILNGRRPPIRHPAPNFSEHNQPLLSGLLGLSDAAIRQLYDTGVTADVPVGAVRPAAQPAPAT